MRMTLELDGMTAGMLEIARVARAIQCTKDCIERSTTEIAATKKRLTEHLKRFQATLRVQKKRLQKQQNELRRQLARVKALRK